MGETLKVCPGDSEKRQEVCVCAWVQLGEGVGVGKIGDI